MIVYLFKMAAASVIITWEKFPRTIQFVTHDILESTVNGKLWLPVQVGDEIDVTDPLIPGLYRVLSLGSETTPWVLDRIEKRPWD